MRGIALNWGIIVAIVVIGVHYLIFNDTSISTDDVVTLPGKILVGTLILVLAVAICGYILGLFWVAIRPHKRAWHDLLSRTMVVYDVAGRGQRRREGKLEIEKSAKLHEKSS